MTKPMTITTLVQVNDDSDDAAIGYELAQDAWLSLSKGVHLNAAAHALVESLLGIVICETREVAAETLVGAVSLFLEVASKPKTIEVSA